ncbi:Putative uncharacterized protein FLJ37770 [Araneus ventricosus]|uniref:Mos1 transposase HTH domain-containing protein n=1 Tax=Araneus ventricosus TaxID=182803 RepID=A0A4Y2H5M6_ARAVE|nr:Putative uncharacterized protein FLJ37770 [Araneus ventricosus]
MEQRVKFCFKLGKTETLQMLVKVYDVEEVSKKCVFEWFKCFRDGKEDVEDEQRSGRPPTSTTPDNIERVRRMLADDRRLSLRMIAEELKVSLDSVSNIVHEHLQKRKICARFVPHKLSDEQKQHRMDRIPSTRVTGIRSSWKQSLQRMSRGSTSTIRRPNNSPWNGVRRFHLPPKSIF